MTSEIAAAGTGMWNTMTSLTRQRVKLNMKLLGQFTGQQPNMKEDKPTYREQFVSPQMSMVSYFLMKVRNMFFCTDHSNIKHDRCDDDGVLIFAAAHRERIR